MSSQRTPPDDIPEPDRLFSAEEQPAEADKGPRDYLEKRPEYARYIRSVRRIEGLLRKKAAKKGSKKQH